MIVTLTANPSLDRTITLPAPLRIGDVQAAQSAREDAGGKGINVARVIASADEQTVAILPLSHDDPLAALLDGFGLETRRVPVSGHARANLTITDPAGTTTKLNLPGAALSERGASALVDAVVREAASAQWLVLAGSLPPGAPDDFYVRIIHAVRQALGEDAPRIAVDTSGAALAAVVADGAPDLIKPNDDELADLLGQEPDDAIDVVLARARDLVPSRVGAALVTLGAQGALLLDGDRAWLGTPPPISVVSTVGAGDSSLAGFVLAAVRGNDPDERLRTAIRYGAAAASLPGTQAPAPHDLPAGDVPVRELT